MNGVFLCKKEVSRFSKTMYKNVLDELISANSLLLIDRFRRFCLSHERWFLSTPPSLRGNIPRCIIMANKGGHVKKVSSGKRGYILREFLKRK